jgi:putative FmdB family regulatory protein
MPIYTYKCENCGIQFERHQSFSDQPLTRCPECSKKSLRKVYTPVGIVFKGSGFYATDHHSPSGQVPTSQSNQENNEKPASETKQTPAKTENSEKSTSNNKSSSDK